MDSKAKMLSDHEESPAIPRGRYINEEDRRIVRGKKAAGVKPDQVSA